MKATITALKAPWPAGAAIGDVVELPEPLPAWALGKCVPAADDAEVTTETVDSTAADDAEVKTAKRGKG